MTEPIFHLVHIPCKYEHQERGICCFCSPLEDCVLVDQWVEDVKKNGEKERAVLKHQANVKNEIRE